MKYNIEQVVEDIPKRIKGLEELKDMGIVSDEEFNQERRELPEML
ncbi:SHOCT domain-containing protein [Clostridium sp. UBA1652]|nr:SHOCT domain-containing protein [Clostridium sp. UBA1652]